MRCKTLLVALALLGIFVPAALAQNPATISGSIWEDIDGDGTWDSPTELGLPGFPVTLSGTDYLSAPVNQSMYTNSSGDYSFTGVLPGNYRVVQNAYPGLAPTYPPSVFYTLDGITWDDIILDLDFGIDTLCMEPTGNYNFLYGTSDNFAGPEPTFRQPGLAAFLATNPYVNPNFDDPTSNEWWGHTMVFSIPDPCYVLNAELCIHVRSSSGGSNNDGFAIGDWDDGGRVWSTSLSELYTMAYPAGDHSWDIGDEMTICLRLDSLPYISGAPWFPLNILSALQDGDLDVFMQDDTECDWVELRIETCCPNWCYADGDFDNDGSPFGIGELSDLALFLNGSGAPPSVPYSCDLNGDGVLNSQDQQLFQDYLFGPGLPVFDPYGGYPVPCPCVTLLNPMPDSIDFSGLLHVSGGTTCLDTTGGRLRATRIIDQFVDSGDVILHLDDDSADAWYGEFKNLDSAGSLMIGAELKVKLNHNDSDVFWIAQTKTSANTWALSTQTDSGAVEVVAMYHGDTVFVDTMPVCPPNCLHSLGSITESIARLAEPQGVYPAGFKGSSTGKPADPAPKKKKSIAWVWPHGHEPLWNWPEHGIINVKIDYLASDDDSLPPLRGDELRLSANAIPNFTINKEQWAQEDTASIFEQQVISQGIAHIDVSGGRLAVSNLGPTYFDGCALSAEHDAKDGEWSLIEIKRDTAAPVGAVIQTEQYGCDGVYPGKPKFIGGTKQTKLADESWAIAARSGATLYMVEAYCGTMKIFEQANVPAAGWLDLGTLGATPALALPKAAAPLAESGGGPYGSSMSNLEDAGIAITIESPDTASWTWPGHGITDSFVTLIKIITQNLPTPVDSFTTTAVYGRDLDSFIVTNIQTSGGDSTNFNGLPVETQGAAQCSTSAGNMYVFGCGCSGIDGLKVGLNGATSWETRLANLDPSGTLPVGAEFTVDFRAIINSVPSQWLMAMSQMKTAANTWLMDIKSIANTYTVNAKRNGVQVFHQTGLSITDLGTITEATGMPKSPTGVYPVGFKGGSTGKPAGIVAAWSSPSSDVTWNWPAQGVTALAIDYLEALPEGINAKVAFDPETATGLSSVRLCARSIPEFEVDSFWIGCCISPTGNVNMAGIVDGGDLALLVAYLTNPPVQKPTLPCVEEANVNAVGIVDGGDLALLVAYLTNAPGQKPTLPDCP